MDLTQEKVENFVCENCGGTLKWNIAKKQLECGSCHTPYTLQQESVIQEHPFEEYHQREQQTEAFPDETVVKCNSCGAEVVFDKDDTAKVCPMCGATQILPQKQVQGVPPDGVLPFEIDKQAAQQKFKKWVRSRWFAPNKLKTVYQEGKLNGVYIPFWTFDTQANGEYHGRGGKEHVREDKDGNRRVEVRWIPVSGHVGKFFDDIQISASMGQVNEVVDKVLPYSTQTKLHGYSPMYLSGFSAERYAIPATQAAETMKEKVRRELKRMAEEDIRSRGFDRADVQHLKLDLEDTTYKQVLLPAWFSSYAYGKKQYMYIINGETGEVGGQRPYSIPKIAAAVVAALVLVGLIVWGSSEKTEAAVFATPTTEVVYQQEQPANTILMKEGNANGLVWTRKGHN